MGCIQLNRHGGSFLLQDLLIPLAETSREIEQARQAGSSLARILVLFATPLPLLREKER